jgi:DNA-binding MarR family transcriptional regulator
MSQVLTTQSNAVRAFTSLLRAHAGVTRHLSAQLLTDHELTISDYEVLLRLANAPDRRMRRVDLAGEVLLTASGITRLLEGLERGGYVERGTCDTDRRVVYAVLTEAGLLKVREASSSHVAQIDELFGGQFDAAELVRMEGLLTRLGGSREDDCTPDA